MAKHGWDVIGIDFVPRAVTIAKRKAAEAQASPRLLVGDVTRLTELGIGADYSLLLDLGASIAFPTPAATPTCAASPPARARARPF